MILRLNSRWPLVWRTPTSVQLGIDPPLLVLDPVTELEERLLAALAVGVSDTGLAMLARGREPIRDDLLLRLAPALRGESPSGTPARVTVCGSGPLPGQLEALLTSRDVRVFRAVDPGELANEHPDLAVVVGHHVLSPALHALWLRRDVPHLPVVFSDGAVTIGPIVEPGQGPCLLCLELHRRDSDPAWPAIATQLFGRDGTSESALTGVEAAAAAARRVLDRLETGPADRHESLRIDATTGERILTPWGRHPECGCGGIGALVSSGPDRMARPRR